MYVWSFIRSPTLSKSNGLERKGDTFRAIVISHSKTHFLLATRCTEGDSVSYCTILNIK